jgi:hypothetical protein
MPAGSHSVTLGQLYVVEEERGLSQVSLGAGRCQARANKQREMFGQRPLDGVSKDTYLHVGSSG